MQCIIFCKLIIYISNIYVSMRSKPYPDSPGHWNPWWRQLRRRSWGRDSWRSSWPRRWGRRSRRRGSSRSRGRTSCPACPCGRWSRGCWGGRTATRWSCWWRPRPRECRASSPQSRPPRPRRRRAPAPTRSGTRSWWRWGTVGGTAPACWTAQGTSTRGRSSRTGWRSWWWAWPGSPATASPSTAPAEIRISAQGFIMIQTKIKFVYLWQSPQHTTYFM